MQNLNVLIKRIDRDISFLDTQTAGAAAGSELPEARLQVTCQHRLQQAGKKQVTEDDCCNCLAALATTSCWHQAGLMITAAVRHQSGSLLALL